MKYLVIGAGIIGVSIAREIAIRKKGDVVILEKENSPGTHTSGRNSGVIHSGINQKPGTLKAKLCVEGNSLLRNYCLERGVKIEECGTIIVANSDHERKKIKDLYLDSINCGVENVRIICKAELKEREPFARGLEALFSPNGSIVDSNSLVKSLGGDAKDNGAEFKYGVKVEKINNKEVETSKGVEKFDFLINCGGLHVDSLAHTSNLGKEYFVVPFRGDYRQVEAKVNGMIYQVPDQNFPFLGVHLTKTIEGKIIAGPTATLSFSGREGYEQKFSKEFFYETANSLNFWSWLGRSLISKKTLKQIVHNLKISSSDREFKKDIFEIYEGDLELIGNNFKSGIRPQIVNRRGRLINDFLIERTQNQIHLLNVVSPGLTCSLAFAKYVFNEYMI